MTVTIKDIALRAGVSISTASNVLNNKTGVIKASEKTRQRILSTAKDLDYSPSIMARGLRSGKSSLAGVIFPVIYGSFYPEILQGVEDVLNSNNYNMILCTYKSVSEYKEKWKVLNAKQVDGIITLPTYESEIINFYAEIKEKMPLVFCAGKIEGLEVPYAYVPPSEIALVGAKRLLEDGHRNICILGPRGEDFMKAFRAEMESCPGAKYIVSTPLKEAESAAKEFLRIQKEFKEMTALIAFNDEIAAKVIYEAGKLGLRAPEDLSVLGVDDLPICRMISPNITTIAQPRREQGAGAAQILLDLINKKEIQKGPGLHPFIVERESCGPVNKGKIL